MIVSYTMRMMVIMCMMVVMMVIMIVVMVMVVVMPPFSLQSTPTLRLGHLGA
jgi:hypothetical protein